MNQIAVSVTLIFSFFSFSLKAQTLSGKVTDDLGEPMIGATVVWENLPTIGAITDTAGGFTIRRPDTTSVRHLIISFLGYKPVVVPIDPRRTFLPVVIQNVKELATVNIEGRKKLGGVSTLDPIQTEVVSSSDLRIAACCNLGESFVSAASVDVNYSDAITGSKEIEMLGLRGIYTQMQMENRPTLSGLAIPFGLDFIPGTWLESIQISKGSGTVVNGAHPMTGQINFELVKPLKAPPLFLNLYASHLGRYEANLQLNHKWSSTFATGLLTHVDFTSGAKDMNDDGFADLLNKKQINIMGRAGYHDKKFESQLSVQALYDNRRGGQLRAMQTEPLPTDSLFTVDITNKRLEAVYKLGYIGFDKPYKSLGWQNSFTAHNLDGRFGFLHYTGDQKSYYTNLIYETILNNTFHKIRTGASFEYHATDERLIRSGFNYGQDRKVYVPGAFLEYAWDAFFKGNDTKVSDMTLIGGMRFDYLSGYGLLWVPRLNFKYNINTSTVVRASAGRGWRSPNVLAEVLSLYASNKTIVVGADSSKPEISWNYGISLTKRFYLGPKEGSLSLDYYRTDFEQQLIPDLDINPRAIAIRMVDRSFSNSFMALYAQEVAKGFDIKLAYKFNDVRAMQNGELRQRLLTPQQRALLTLHYTYPNKRWDISLIGQYTGSQRLAPVSGFTGGLPEYRIKAESPGFFTLNSQLNVKLNNTIEVYIGAENLLNYMQDMPIIGYDNIYQTSSSKPVLDASQVYGPVMGVSGYIGLRMTMQEGWNEKEVLILTSAKCEMCKEKIETALKAVPGVKNADLDLETKKVKVIYSGNKVSIDMLRRKISETGYDADNVHRIPDAYEALPECCK